MQLIIRHVITVSPGSRRFLLELADRFQRPPVAILERLDALEGTIIHMNKILEDEITALVGVVGPVTGELASLKTFVLGVPALTAAAVTAALADIDVSEEQKAALVKSARETIQASVQDVFEAAGLNANPGGGTADVLVLTTTALPDGTVGGAYSGNLIASGGTAPYTFASSPPSDNGVSINGDGSVTGTVEAEADSSFSVTVTDSTGATASGGVTLHAA